MQNLQKPNKEKTTYEVTINEIIVSGEMAVARDTWKFTTAGNAEAQPKTVTARSFEVWRRQADRTWKISRWITALEPVADR